MKSANSKRVSWAVTMQVGAGDSVGCCDAKTARDNTLFLCLLLAEGCGELAVVEDVGGCRMASLGFVVLA